jgi:ribosomal protein S18 acetylase RimI-like enzyme
MFTIQRVDSSEMIEKVHTVITKSFSTVAQEFHFTKESVPHFPAFITVDVIQKQIKNGLVLFASVESDQVIGSIGIKDTGNNIFKIERLAVLPDHRHYKIGQTLMNYAINRIIENNGTVAKVEIVYENIVLRKWYENQGFHVIAVDLYESLPFQVGVLTKELW